MATIKISRAKSCSAALGYAEGKNKLDDDTKDWLKEQGVDPEKVNQLSDRAVIKDGLFVTPEFAKSQMKQTRDLFANSGSTEAMRVIQSFPADELNAADPADWQRCNDLGRELAEKIAPNHQIAVYTHIDGEGHKLHNHIIINMPNLETGRKYHHNNDWQRITTLNDTLCREHQLSVPERTQSERHTMAERQLATRNNYVWKDDLRHRVDEVMHDTSICDFKAVSERLEQKGVILHERGQNVSYAFLDANNKQRRARGKTLGKDYEKEAIEHELEDRVRQRTEQKLAERDESRVTDVVREAEQRKQETANADTTLNQRERATTKSGQGIDRLTNATGRVRTNQQENIRSVNQRTHLRTQIRAAIKPIADGLQRFTDAIQGFAKQIGQRLADQRLYQDVASRFKADMARKKQIQRKEIKQDLAKRTTPKPNRAPKHPAQTYYHDRGGLER